MTKIIKKISVPLVSLLLLINMSSAGYAETTISAEVGFVFNYLLNISLSDLAGKNLTFCEAPI